MKRELAETENGTVTPVSFGRFGILSILVNGHVHRTSCLFLSLARPPLLSS
jgi:hypothetical protein